MRALAIMLLLLAAVPADAADRLTVILDWYVNPDHGPLVIAQQKGFFADAGLAVELVAPADPTDAPKLVAAKTADIGVSYQPQLHLQVDAGLPLVRIGTLVATPLNCLLIRGDSGIRQVSDLKGKTVGFSVGGLEDVLMRVILQHVGLPPDAVRMVNVNFSLAPSVMSRQVDAVIGAYRNVELVQMQEAGVPGRCFYIEEEGVPVHDELIYIAHRDRLDRPELGRFMTAVEQATLWLLNHPDEAWALFKQQSPELDDAVTQLSWTQTLRRFSPSPRALDHARYKEFAAFLHDQGLIGPPPPLASYAVDLGDR